MGPYTIFEKKSDISEEKESFSIGETAMKKKYKLYFVSIIIMMIIIFLPNKYISLSVAFLFLMGVLIFFYKNISILIDTTYETETNTRTLKNVIIFCIVMMFLTIIGAILVEKDMLTEFTERMYANAIIIIIILWFGKMAEKVPFNGFIGLRLPWMLQDEQTWNFGHRLLGYCSIPLSVIYLALIPFIDNRILSNIIVALWIVIPGIGSYIFYKRKYHS